MAHPNFPNTNRSCYNLWMAFWLCGSSFVATAQVSINGPVHIAAGGALHIDLPETTFHNGMVTTDRNGNYGLLSFGSNAKAIDADHSTHVNGYVRMHASNGFSFPVGHDAILQPVHIDHLVPPLR